LVVVVVVVTAADADVVTVLVCAVVAVVVPLDVVADFVVVTVFVARRFWSCWWRLRPSPPGRSRSTPCVMLTVTAWAGPRSWSA
jgi:hypothetical protein